MTTNVFRPIDGETILPARIYQGQNWKNISFGINATVAEYKAKGLYLEVGEKPAITKYQNLVLDTETIDHTTKTVILAWAITTKTQAEIDEIDRLDGIEVAQTAGGLKGISEPDAKAWVTARLMQAQESVQLVTNVATAKTAMNQILLAIQDINHRETPYLLK